MWNLANQTDKNETELIDMDKRLVIIRREGSWGVGKMELGVGQLYGDRWELH